MQTIEDWNRVTVFDIKKLGGATLLNQYSLSDILRKKFPEYSWDTFKSKNEVAKSHLTIFNYIKEFFPNAGDIFVDYHHPQLQFSNSQANMQFDIFIPSLNFAFEFQGNESL